MAAELTAEERAILAAALLDPGGARVVARLAEPTAGRVGAELAAALAVPREARVRLIVAEVRRALALPAAGSWLEAALADEPPAVRAAARGETPGTPAPVRRWLLRALAAGR